MAEQNEKRKTDLLTKIIMTLFLLLLSAYAYFGVEAKGNIADLQKNKLDKEVYFLEKDSMKRYLDVKFESLEVLIKSENKKK